MYTCYISYRRSHSHLGVIINWKLRLFFQEREKEMAMAARNNLFPKEATLANGEASAEEGMSPRIGAPLLIRDHPPPAQISQVQKVHEIFVLTIFFLQ